VIIGTAGHIDHGKSALVQALTGRQMDRLAEERARGITIDLNFAPLCLPGGSTAGVVDVPGHEDFVRTMVAGAAGMDLVLLVIAADEGVMPQTREHLAIVEALGVPRGIPVLTKSDLVEAEWLRLLQEEVNGWLAASPVAFTAAMPVSAVTGAGLEALRRVLREEVEGARPRDDSAPFRMPVDRSFSVPGAGTVVTGSVWAGTVAVGDQVRLLPVERSARVRTVEVHGARVERAAPGARAALGLANVDRQQVRRGDVVVDSRLPWESTLALDVRLRLLESAPHPLTSRTRVHLHLGTAEVVARVLPRAPIPPGATGFARLTCEAPLVAQGGDRFVVRSYSPVTTIGGGVVLDPLPPRRRPLWPDHLDSPDPGERLLALLARHPPGVSSESLAVRSGLSVTEVDDLLAGDARARLLPGGWVVADLVGHARVVAASLVAAYHAEHPSHVGMPMETLRKGTHRARLVAEAAVEDLVRSGALVAEAAVVRVPAFETRIAGGTAAVDRVIALVRAAGLSAPPIQELERQLEPMDVTGALRLGAGAGRLEAVTRDWYVAREALDGFRATLREAGAGGDITVAGIRERTGLSRKYLIPLLDWADRQGITRRNGEARRLT
jgi:selenocysteine-specific elongation factor